MGINEVFKNPTVKQVAFELVFPNLFGIENKIGEFQIKIFDKFPDSRLLNRRQLVFADVGPEGKLENIPSIDETSKGKRIWQFISENKYELNITNNSLTLISKIHKSYNRGTSEKFKDIIEYVITPFIEVIKIPVINRLGLRYIDDCPIFEKTNKSFREYYNTMLPLNKFKLEDSEELFFRGVTQRKKYNLIYMEQLIKEEPKWKLVMDFDASALNVKPTDIIPVTDKLHDIISNEYDERITEKFKEYMRD
jgi:uncharacterized protein (TIGR04255 family)